MRFVRKNNKKIAAEQRLRNGAALQKLLLFLTTIAFTQLPFFAVGLHFCKNDPAVLIFIKFDIRSFCARIISMDTIHCYMQRRALGAHVKLENRNLIVKLLYHFGNQIRFSRSPSMTTNHSDWYQNRSDALDGSVPIWDLHLCIRKQLSSNTASNYLILAWHSFSISCSLYSWYLLVLWINVPRCNRE